MAKKAPHSFREVAQIIINLRNNPNQLCIRFDDLKEAEKQYAKLDAAMRSDSKSAFFSLFGSIITVTVDKSSVEAWSLISIEALNRMMSQPAPAPQ